MHTDIRYKWEKVVPASISTSSCYQVLQQMRLWLADYHLQHYFLLFQLIQTGCVLTAVESSIYTHISVAHGTLSFVSSEAHLPCCCDVVVVVVLLLLILMNKLFFKAKHRYTERHAAYSHMHILVFRFITGGVHRPTHPAQEAWSFGEDTKGTQHQPQDPLSAQDPETSAEGHFGQKGFMVFTVTAHCFSSWVSSFCCFEQFCCSSFCFFVVVVFVLLSLFSQCIKLTIGTANVETPAETQSTTLLIFPGLDQIWLPKSLCNACCYWLPKSLCNACCHWLTRSLCNVCCHWLTRSLCNACCHWLTKSLCNACCYWLPRSLYNTCGNRLPKSQDNACCYWLPKSLCDACCHWLPKSLCDACCHWLTRSLCNPCL